MAPDLVQNGHVGEAATCVGGPSDQGGGRGVLFTTVDGKRVDCFCQNLEAAHHHARELLPFYEEAKARGVKRLFLNHPTYVNDCSFQDITHLVGMGVKMEHSACMFIESTFKMFDTDHLKSVIDAAGVENTFFGTDLGQKNNPNPAEGMRMMIGMLLDCGYTDDEVRQMTTTVGAELVGLAA